MVETKPVSLAVVHRRILLDALRTVQEVSRRKLYIEMIPFFSMGRFDDLIDSLIKARYCHALGGRLFYIPE